MSGKLEGVRVAAVVEEGCEQAEFVEPKRALEEAGVVVERSPRDIPPRSMRR